MKVGDRVRHIPLPNGSTLGEGTVIQVGNNKVDHETILVDFHDYKGKLPVRWMIPETLEVVPRFNEVTTGNWLFAHFLFLPFVWVMDKLGIRS